MNAKTISAFKAMSDDDLQFWFQDYLYWNCNDAAYVAGGFIHSTEERWVVVDVDQEVRTYTDDNGEDHETVSNVAIYGCDDVPVKIRIVPEDEKELIKRLDHVMLGCLDDPYTSSKNDGESYW